MRKTITALIAACSLSLASCSSVPNVTVTTGTNIVAEVQSIAQEVCGFLPIASTVLGILSGGTFTSATAIAAAICSAVATTKAASKFGGKLRASGAPRIGGVPVIGTFVR